MPGIEFQPKNQRFDNWKFCNKRNFVSGRYISACEKVVVFGAKVEKVVEKEGVFFRTGLEAFVLIFGICGCWRLVGWKKNIFPLPKNQLGPSFLEGFGSVWRRVLLDLKTTSFEIPWFLGLVLLFFCDESHCRISLETHRKKQQKNQYLESQAPYF